METAAGAVKNTRLRSRLLWRSDKWQLPGGAVVGVNVRPSIPLPIRPTLLYYFINPLMSLPIKLTTTITNMICGLPSLFPHERSEITRSLQQSALIGCAICDHVINYRISRKSIG